MVRFSDMRFYYDTLFFHGRSETPLSGTVYVNSDNRVVQMQLGHRIDDH